MAHTFRIFFSGLLRVGDCTLPHPHASCYSCFFFLPEPLAKKVCFLLCIWPFFHISDVHLTLLKDYSTEWKRVAA